MSTLTPPDTISCLLCGGAYLYPGPRYSAHLLNEHGVVYDIDFIVEVSLHKKTFSSLPAVLIPGISTNLAVSDNSSQTEATRNEARCNSCYEYERQEDQANGLDNLAPEGGDRLNELWLGKVQDDEELHQGEDEIYGDQPEYMIIKPDIDEGVGSRSNIFKKASKLSIPRASDLQCYFNCGEVFKKGYDLELHLKLRHKDENPQELARAAEAAKFEIALTRRSGTVYKCAICAKTVQGWSPFWEHIRKHKVNFHDYRAQYGKCKIESASFQCRICDKVLEYETNIIHKHLQGVHSINWTQYLARVRNVFRGIEQEPLPEVILEQCKLCDQRVKYLKEHLKNKHGIIKKVPCRICDQSFKYLQTHLKRKHGITKDEYDQFLSDREGGDMSPTLDLNENVQVPEMAHTECSAMDISDNVRSSKTSDSSRKHLRKPTKEEMSDKKVKHCSVCEVQFATRNLFIEHCQTVHHVKFKTKAHGFMNIVASQPQDTPPSSGQDSTCPENFYNQHPKQVSKIVLPMQSFRQDASLACELCGEKFTSWKYLDQHMKLNCHRVACEACGKTYSSLANLKKHRRLSCLGIPQPDPVNIAREIVEQTLSNVFAVSVLKCPFENCGQKFGRSVHLKRHLSNSHDEQI